jgi:hypothetical protein
MIPAELENLFNQIRTPVILATAGEKPHATPMNWFYNGNLWISPAGGTKKIENMRRNKNVCIACLEDMRPGGRGFILWGRIESMETGFIAFLRHARILKSMLEKKSSIGVGIKLLRYARIYASHPSIRYSALPWRRYFVRIRILRGKYWLEKGKEVEFISPT